MKMSKAEAGRLGALKAAKSVQDRYKGNPKLCSSCNKALPYEKRYNKFCDSSCAASFNNKKRQSKKACVNCGNTINRSSKLYCSYDCQREYEYKERLEEFLKGDNVSYNIKTIKKLLIMHYGHKCSSCGNTEWLGNPIPLEAHHIDGDATNNRFINFSLLCPNCHSLTDNYKSKNKQSTRTSRKKYYS